MVAAGGGYQAALDATDAAAGAGLRGGLSGSANGGGSYGAIEVRGDGWCCGAAGLVGAFGLMGGLRFGRAHALTLSPTPNTRPNTTTNNSSSRRTSRAS